MFIFIGPEERTNVERVDEEKERRGHDGKVRVLRRWERRPKHRGLAMAGLLALYPQRRDNGA